MTYREMRGLGAAEAPLTPDQVAYLLYGIAVNGCPADLANAPCLSAQMIQILSLFYTGQKPANLTDQQFQDARAALGTCGMFKKLGCSDIDTAPWIAMIPGCTDTSEVGTVFRNEINYCKTFPVNYPRNPSLDAACWTLHRFPDLYQQFMDVPVAAPGHSMFMLPSKKFVCVGDCSPGYVWDANGNCVATAGAAPTTCPPGHSMFKGQCVGDCSPGYVWDANGNCIPVAAPTPPPPKTCSAGFHLVGSDCVADVKLPTPCDTGYIRDSSGTCVLQADTTKHILPADDCSVYGYGYTRDPVTGACVPPSAGGGGGGTQQAGMSSTTMAMFGIGALVALGVGYMVMRKK